LLRVRLGELITKAINLLNSTHEAMNGTNIPVNEYWATPEVRAIFNNAIENAQKVYDTHLS